MTETAPETAATVSEDEDRPHAPVVAGLVAVAAALAGAAAFVLFGWVSGEGWQLVIALAVIVAGAVLARPAGDPDVRRGWVLGRWVLAGIGAAGVVLGAYLAGIALVTMSLPDGPVFRGSEPDLPSPITILLLLYGIPLIALIVLAVRGRSAGVVGTGLVTPVLAVSILAAAGANASVVAISSLVVAVVCVPLAVLSASRWGSLAMLVGMMAASFAVGAGVSPFGSLATSTSRPTSRANEAETTVGTLPSGLVPVVLICALGATALLLAVAVSRRDVAAGLVGAALFAVPPAYLLLPTTSGGSTPSVWALAVIPAAVLLVALGARFAPALRTGLTRVLRLPGAQPSAFVAAAGVAAVVLVVQGIPVLGTPGRLSGVITLVVLAAAVVLAAWLSGTAGAVLAGVSLAGLQLGAPWQYVISGELDVRDGIPDWRLAAIVGLFAAVAAAMVLIRRHPRPGVWAAAAYLLAGAIADLLWTLVGASGRLFYGGESDVQALVVLLAPLLALGIPAAIAALRGSAAGQAVGAVVVAAAAFIPLHALAGELPSGGARNADIATQISIAPFTPTNAQGASRLLEVGVPTLLGVLAVLVLSLVLLASTGRRPSAPLAAAVTLAIVVGVQVVLLSALEEWRLDGLEAVGWITLALATAAGIAAAVTTTAIGNRRHLHRSGD